ncbi:reverse transcriptase [Intoshia linei]|uniref:Reverse transcriptase n=1 Tax=Intoshia linei TaxID=1819745 RepID=A0A177B588_9BILA|nr:reverse transcriptase [Intoshia linei]
MALFRNYDLIEPSKYIDHKNFENISFTDIIKRFYDVISSNIGRTSLIEHSIMLKLGYDFRKIKPFAIGMNVRDKHASIIKKLLRDDVIEVSKSSKDGTDHMVNDFCYLNSFTVRDLYPHHDIKEALDLLEGFKIFSTMYFTNGFWQISLVKSDRWKTAFTTSFGEKMYQYKVMPQCLTNSPATCQRLMEKILRNIPCVTVYLDDVIIGFKIIDQHKKDLIKVFEAIRAAKLTLNPKKCVIGSHIIDHNGIRVDTEKVVSIQSIKTPNTVKRFRRFLGISDPLYQVLKKNVKFYWGDSQELAFTKLKKSLTVAIVLTLPKENFDFTLKCNASNIDVGSVLMQNGHVIEYFSRKLTSTEQNYSTTQKELLAVLLSILKFRRYLLGRHFIVFTDHNPLVHLRISDKSPKELLRWIIKLEDFDYDIIYKPGKLNKVGDFLSRDSCEFSIKQINFNSINAVEIQDNQQFREILETGIVSQNNIYYRIKNIIIIKDRVIYVNKNDRNLILVSRKFIKAVICYYPNSLIFAHPGITKLFHLIRHKYFWPKMYQHIKDYVIDCVKCNTCKYRNHLYNKKLKIVETTYPNKLWQVDISGPFNETSKLNRYLLIMCDHFSGWCAAEPMQSISADNLNSLKERLSLKLCSTFNIDKLHSKPYCHNENGLVERFNRVICEKLRIMCNDTHDNWDNMIDYVLMGIRNTISSKNICTPAELIIGHTSFESHYDLNINRGICPSSYVNMIVRYGDNPAQRVKIKLFDSIVPKTAKYFRMLCTTGKFRNTKFFNVINSNMLVGGDFTHNDRNGNDSYNGGLFSDENFTLSHDIAGVVSMLSKGKDTNGSQFYITSKPLQTLDNINVVFGKVVENLSYIIYLSNISTNSNNVPIKDIIIVDCY